MDNEANIKCIACKTFLRSSPLRFGCGHYLCTTCFSRNLLLSKFSAFFPVKPEFALTCPCSSGSLSLTLDRCVEIISELQQNNIKYCSKHSIPLKVYCSHCEIWLCEECCALFHNDLFRYHNCTERPSTSKSICAVHINRPREHFCYKCNTSICMECYRSMNEHAEHPMLTFQMYQRVVKQKKQKLKYKTYSELESYLNEKMQHIMDAHNKKVQYVQSQLDQGLRKLKEIKKEFLLKSEEHQRRTQLLFQLVKKVYEEYYKELNEGEFNLSSLDFLKEVNQEIHDITLVSIDSEQFFQAIQKIPNIKGDMFDIKFIFNPVHIKHTQKLYANNPTTALCALKNKKDFVTGHLDGLISVYRSTVSDNNEEISFKWSSVKGHEKVINTIKELTSGDDNTIRFISGASDNLIQVWECVNNNVADNEDPPTVKFTHKFKNHTSIIDIIELTDKRIVLSGSDKSIKIWTMSDLPRENSDYDIIERIELTKGVDYEKCLCEIDKDVIASGSGDKKIKIWNVLTKSVQQCLTGHNSYVNTLLLKDKTTLISGGGDGFIIVWYLQEQGNKNQCTHKVLEGHRGAVQGIVLVQGNRIVSCSNDKSVMLWDLNKLSCTYRVNECHKSAIYGICVIRDKMVVTGGNDYLINCYIVNDITKNNNNNKNKNNDADDEEYGGFEKEL